MRRSRKFCQRGSNSDRVFLTRRNRIQITLKLGHHRPAGKRHLNGILLACPWWLNIECWLGSFVIFKGIRTSIAKRPYIFVIFQGGGGGPDPLSPLWTHTWDQTFYGLIGHNNVCLHTHHVFYIRVIPSPPPSMMHFIWNRESRAQMISRI